MVANELHHFQFVVLSLSQNKLSEVQVPTHTPTLLGNKTTTGEGTAVAVMAGLGRAWQGMEMVGLDWVDHTAYMHINYTSINI